MVLAPLQVWNVSAIPVLLGGRSPALPVQLLLVVLVPVGIMTRNRLAHYAIVVSWLLFVGRVVFVARPTPIAA